MYIVAIHRLEHEEWHVILQIILSFISKTIKHLMLNFGFWWSFHNNAVQNEYCMLVWNDNLSPQEHKKKL